MFPLHLLGHAQHTVNFRNAQPMQNLHPRSIYSTSRQMWEQGMWSYVRHQSLEAHILSNKGLALFEMLSQGKQIFTLTPAMFSVRLKYSLAPEGSCEPTAEQCSTSVIVRSIPRFPGASQLFARWVVFAESSLDSRAL
jgi:hypothetical protein